jgi:cation transport protein ChaC
MDFWVFAYGSLMWRPNFTYTEAAPALLEGAHRALCIYSVTHRGTHEFPGLVLGLDHGGRCQGLAFRVPAAHVQETRIYLKRRENVTNTYASVIKTVTLLDGSSRHVPALSFLANRRHQQYAGDLPLEKQAFMVRRSVGASGRNLDYVVNTVNHLRDLNVWDAPLERLMAALGRGAFRASNA